MIKCDICGAFLAGNLCPVCSTKEVERAAWQGKTFYRTIALAPEVRADEGKRSLPVSFSSEDPVERWYGMEILDHSPDAVIMGRFLNRAPLLRNHDTRNHIGVIENPSIGADRKLRATARFGKRGAADDAYQDVQDGILCHASIGYRVNEMVLESESNGIKTYRVTKWEPMEGSLCPMGADDTVGPNRTAAPEKKPTISITQKTEEKRAMEKCTICQNLLVDGKCPVCAERAASVEKMRAEKERVREIRALGKLHEKQDLADEAIEKGTGLDAFRATLLADIKKPGTGPNPPGTVVVGDNLAAKPAYRSIGEQLIDVRAANQPDGSVARERLMNVQKRAISGMSTSVPSDGGFLMETEFTTALLDKPEEVSQISPRCTKIPIGPGFDSLEAPFIDETSRATGSRWGGIQVYREGESLYPSGKKPKIGQFEIRLFDLKAICYATNRLLNNATALGAIISKGFRSEMFFKLDDEIFQGTGAGQCIGILNAPCLISVAKETGQKAATILTENVNKMYNALFAASRGNAVWLYNQECEPQLEVLSVAIGTGGVLVPMFVPAGVGNNNTGTAKLKGLPAIPVEQAAALGTKGDLILADLSGYILVDQGGIDVQSSIHVKFLEDETAFRFIYRVNGAPRLRQAIVPYKGSTSHSHFVSLDTRG